MDYHVGFVAGDESRMQNFLGELDKRGITSITRGRNQFESVLMRLDTSAIIVQILFFNAEREIYGFNHPGEFHVDPPLPGCLTLNSDLLREYESLVKESPNFAEFFEKYTGFELDFRRRLDDEHSLLFENVDKQQTQAVKMSEAPQLISQ